MLLVTHAAQLVTMAGPARARKGPEMQEIGVIRDGAVLIDGDRIAWTGPTGEVRKHLPAGEPQQEIDATGQLVVPGLVDSHTHLIFAAPRLDDFERHLRGETYEQIAAAGGGIRSSVARLRQAADEALLRHTVDWLTRARRDGTTTIEIKSGYGLSRSEERRMLRIAACAAAETGFDVARTFLGAHALPPEFDGRREEFVREVIDGMMPATDAGDAEFCDVFCERGAFTVAESAQILRAAQGKGWGLKLHAEQLSHTGATQLGVQLGAVSVDHLEWTDAEDHRRLGAAATVATLLPGVSLFLDTRRAPARALIEAGAAVALASDFNPGSSPILSMPFIMALGCTALGLSPAEAWTAATINGAAALRRAGRCGVLQPGWRADLAIFDVDDFRAVPYFAATPLCRGVVQAGRWIPGEPSRPRASGPGPN